MAVTITATLVAASEPRPVLIVVEGVPGGTGYSVVGTAAGSSWMVPGGSGTSTGAQVVLVDNRAALNTPVTYQVVAAGVTYSAAPVVVQADGRYVLQSLDGQVSAGFVWQSNGLPNELVVRSQTFDVPGRRRPPGRYVEGGDGGGSLMLRATRAGSQVLSALVRSGRPMVLRTDGAVRDLPAVDLLVVRRASSRLWDAYDGGTGQMSTDRVWVLEYDWVDDPEPGRVLGAFIWDDFDEAMTGYTWSAAAPSFDALFAGSTWDDFDTFDWGQL